MLFPPGQATCQPAVGVGGYGGVTPHPDLGVVGGGAHQPVLGVGGGVTRPPDLGARGGVTRHPALVRLLLPGAGVASKAPLQLPLSQNPQQEAPLDPQTGHRALKSWRHQHHLRRKQCLQYIYIC